MLPEVSVHAAVAGLQACLCACSQIVLCSQGLVITADGELSWWHTLHSLHHPMRACVPTDLHQEREPAVQRLRMVQVGSPRASCRRHCRWQYSWDRVVKRAEGRKPH